AAPPASGDALCGPPAAGGRPWHDPARRAGRSGAPAGTAAGPGRGLGMSRPATRGPHRGRRRLTHADRAPARKDSGMRIIVVNVNTSESMTGVIGEAARRHASAGTEIVALRPYFGAE